MIYFKVTFKFKLQLFYRPLIKTIYSILLKVKENFELLEMVEKDYDGELSEALVHLITTVLFQETRNVV